MVGWLATQHIESYEDTLAADQQQTKTEEVLRQMRSDAAALSASINGDHHESLVQAYGQMDYSTWADTPKELQTFRSDMMTTAQNLGIDAQLTTYRIKQHEARVVDARSNELRPDALQEFFSSDKTSHGWAGNAPYLPDMEQPLVPHQPVSVLTQTQEGLQAVAFAPIEGAGRELTGFIQLRSEVPIVPSKADERSALVLPVVGGLAALFMALIVGINRTLRGDLRNLQHRISTMGNAEEDLPTPPMLGELHNLVQQIDETSQSLQRKIGRESSSREELESRLRDAELGLCPSRRAHRERFTQASKTIQVSVSVDRSRFVPGTLVDLTLEEAIMALPAGGAVDLAPGFPAHVRIQSAGEDQIADFVVETVNRTSVGKVCLVRLRITNPANLRNIPRDLRHLVDNRQSVRVRPDSRNPVIARVIFNRGREERNARLLDISNEGAGLTVRADLWQCPSATIELRLILPGTEETIRMPARINYANRHLAKFESVWNLTSREPPIIPITARSRSTWHVARQNSRNNYKTRVVFPVRRVNKPKTHRTRLHSYGVPLP